MKFNDPFNDPGHKYDSVKWDFPEDSLSIVYIEGYPYKVNKTENARFLHYIRGEISRLISALRYISMQELFEFYSKSSSPYSFNEFIEGLKEFIDIHEERPRNDLYQMVPEFRGREAYGMSSRYLLSEVPKEGRKMFLGINKPRMRYESGGSSTGIDGGTRCVYRDIFLSSRDDSRAGNGNELKGLIYHELGHGLVGHLRYRDKENHQGDHKLAEKLLKTVGARMGFLGDFNDG
jgi:hypothetical protein